MIVFASSELQNDKTLSTQLIELCNKIEIEIQFGKPVQFELNFLQHPLAELSTNNHTSQANFHYALVGPVDSFSQQKFTANTPFPLGVVEFPRSTDYNTLILRILLQNFAQVRIHEIERFLSREKLGLTQTELALARSLILIGQRGASREFLQNSAWPDVHVQLKTLDTHLFNLRRKLETLDVEITFDRRLQGWRFTKSIPELSFPQIPLATQFENHYFF